MDTKVIRQQMKTLRAMKALAELSGNEEQAKSIAAQLKPLNAMMRQVNAIKLVSNLGSKD
jgi:Zn-dependent M16 (insulinase) family peptidase